MFQAQTNIVHLLICHAQEIAFSQCVQTFTLCVSGSDEHRAPVDLSRPGDRFLSVCTNLYTVCFRLRRTSCTCCSVTPRRSLSLGVYKPLHCVFQAQKNIVHLLFCHAQEIAFSVYKPLHCVSGSDEHRAPVVLSRPGDRFLSLCTNLYTVFQAQTNIVHLLICHAQEIGTVADELYERTCLYGCFRSEDELERSEDLNESKPKKKKKRSGSLQG